MFDVGFSEMMVIAVVALIVIGPEKLPKVARTLGHLVGRLQRYVGDVKADINREMELDELRKFKDEFQSGARAVEQTIHDEFQRAEADVRSVADEATAAVPETQSDQGSDAPREAIQELSAPVKAAQSVVQDPARGVNQA